jgi:hypothetical protein
MSTDEEDHTGDDEKPDSDKPDNETTESSDDKDQSGEKQEFELSDEGKQKVDEMQKAYDDDRPTAVLPGTDNTITGVAVNEWLDDDGNPKFGKDEQNDNADSSNDDADEHHDDEAKQHEDAD